MSRWFLKSVGLGALSLLAWSAQAIPILPVQNLTFSSYTGGPPKDLFSYVDPVGWTGGTGLISIDAPGTATMPGNGSPGRNAYPVYGPFSNPPPGGNFIQADGNPDFETSFNQTITGLTAGTEYSLSFWQAAGQQTGFSGQTTEEWLVFFGNDGFTVNCGSNPCTAAPVGTTQEDISTLMTTPSEGVIGWNEVTMNFTADAPSDVLSFLAWGDNGNTTNLPPTVFLAGVNTPAHAPEPASLSLLAVALLGLGAGRLRRPGKRTED